MRANSHEPGPLAAKRRSPRWKHVGLLPLARHQRKRARMYFVASAAERASVTAPPWVTPS